MFPSHSFPHFNPIKFQVPGMTCMPMPRVSVKIVSNTTSLSPSLHSPQKFRTHTTEWTPVATDKFKLCQHCWLSAELGCQPSATGLFRLLPLVSGTICHSTSRLQNLCLASAVASRLISLGAAFRDTLTVVVPEKWLCHSGHDNRFC